MENGKNLILIIADHNKQEFERYSRNLYSMMFAASEALFEQFGSLRLRFFFFTDKKRQHLHTRSATISRVFPINYIRQVGARNAAWANLCTREPRAAANADLRKIGVHF